LSQSLDDPLSLAAIRRALAAHPAAPHAAKRWPPGLPSAAVALALAGGESDLALAMILRAEREGDPWSGQMALPGGRADPGDASPESVAERETAEEIGISLRREQLVAALEDQPVRRGGVNIGMRLYPFVYHLGLERPAFKLNHEVAEAYWVPLHHLADPVQARRHRFERGGQPFDFPAIAFQDRVIWGVTYRVLAEFFGRLGVTLPE
jgi:8-oxo-dGTP pyrophosphatase MutT (NUDIX family)